MPRMSPVMRAVVVGLVLSFGSTLAWRFAQKAPEIAIAWANMQAERQRRLAAQEEREAQDEKTRAAQQAIDEAYNELNCKVFVGAQFLQKAEIVTGVRTITSSGQYGSFYLSFGGGVRRLVSPVVKTENCR